MTCIIGIERRDGSYLLADSLGSAGWESTHRRDGKLHELRAAGPHTPGLGLGFTSSYRMGQALGYGMRGWAKSLNLDDLGAGFEARHEWMVTTFIPEVRTQLKDAGFMKVDSSREEGGTFIVALGRTVFTVSCDLQVGAAEEGFEAVGCGAPYALGAMHASDPVLANPLERATAGMKAAMHYSNGVGGRLDVLSVMERAGD